MTKTRLEAFSDGVIAIIITIMVLEMKAPHGASLEALLPLWPVFLSYALSFAYVAIYWNNHHHLFQAVDHVRGVTLWSNLFVLFWLSLIPFATAWMGENSFQALPVALYGAVLVMAALAWEIQRRVLLGYHDRDSKLFRAIGQRKWKEWSSLLLYGSGIGLAFVQPWLAIVLYSAATASWIIPDRRIETHLAGSAEQAQE